MRANASSSGARLVRKEIGSRSLGGTDVVGMTSFVLEEAFLDLFERSAMGVAEELEEVRFLVTRFAALRTCLTILSEVKMGVRISGVDLAMASGLDRD